MNEVPDSRGVTRVECPSYPIEVRLVKVTSDSEELVEAAGRLCWDTQSKTGTTPDRIQKWIRVGHESMIEHASATFYIRASRILTHELVRHRIASYSQRSQRYVEESKPRYVHPPELFWMKECEAGQRVEYVENPAFLECMDTCWATYRYLLKEGYPKEIARYVLPGACETQIMMTMNFRELRHFIRVRTSPRALPEMRCVAEKIREVCKSIAPQVFEDL